ncbi:NAD(P)H-binding protein [Saccharopolyspora indica]|uniref:NmrA family NAD(P)-binding protein n=1 Tax=Saccharopolyspora indica TaxID=1229659 RepID=UPI0022EA884F|nr:NAD(P)H-binding protein [Saccharopolyspora indica]MDA3649028.1 NAD(P)H-binding protein [Saccharopolyspora indica]
MENEHKIVVTTPTGHVGSRVVRLLLQAGVRPTLLMRTPDKLDAATRDLVDVVPGDQGDADTVLRATRGADCLFWVDPPTPDDDPAAGYARMGANAARAVRENGISRTVFLSSIGAEKRHGVGEIDGLARTEELLNATGAGVLHLRCGYFFTNLFMDLQDLREGVLRTPWPLDYAMPWVDPRDIGEIAAARLLATNWSGCGVQAVHGPEDLTFAQVAEILSRSVGREVRAERISDDEFRAALRSAGLSSGQVEGIVGMSVGQREDFVPEDVRSIVTTTPTTLAAWAHAWLRPAL